ncbi:MAG: hypothetical protein AAB153_03840 [Pseudomonadota bacterium]
MSIKPIFSLGDYVGRFILPIIGGGFFYFSYQAWGADDCTGLALMFAGFTTWVSSGAFWVLYDQHLEHFKEDRKNEETRGRYYYHY